ncbi:MAG TPA: hypothetical protein VF498_01540 [Anaerolineales bacterium]
MNFVNCSPYNSFLHAALDEPDYTSDKSHQQTESEEFFQFSFPLANGCFADTQIPGDLSLAYLAPFQQSYAFGSPFSHLFSG